METFEVKIFFSRILLHRLFETRLIWHLCTWVCEISFLAVQHVSLLKVPIQWNWTRITGKRPFSDFCYKRHVPFRFDTFLPKIASKTKIKYIIGSSGLSKLVIMFSFLYLRKAVCNTMRNKIFSLFIAYKS